MTEAQIRQEVLAQIEKAFSKAQAEDPSRGPEWLAHTMRISLSKVNRLRKGEGDPDLIEIWRLAQALGLPIGWFAGEAIEADQRLASAAERAETAITMMQSMLDQLRADLTEARTGRINEVKIGVTGGAGDLGVARASTSRRKKRAKQVSEPVAPARKAAS